jgi:hypothetical protein
MTQADQMVGHRSELLARVALTRRLNIDVSSMDIGGAMGIDFLCSIRDPTLPGFLPFGVLVWGTSNPLDTSEDLAKQVRGRRKKLDKRTRYFIPVIVLLFSMHNDREFYTWLVEPCEDSTHLMDVADLDFKPFDTRQLDRVIRRITNWYRRLAADIRPETAEINSSQLPDHDQDD